MSELVNRVGAEFRLAEWLVLLKIKLSSVLGEGRMNESGSKITLVMRSERAEWKGTSIVLLLLLY